MSTFKALKVKSSSQTITQDDHVSVILQHDVSVEILLSPVKSAPLLSGEVQSHILKGQRLLKTQC